MLHRVSWNASQPARQQAPNGRVELESPRGDTAFPRGCAASSGCWFFRWAPRFSVDGHCRARAPRAPRVRRPREVRRRMRGVLGASLVACSVRRPPPGGRRGAVTEAFQGRLDLGRRLREVRLHVQSTSRCWHRSGEAAAGPTFRAGGPLGAGGAAEAGRGRVRGSRKGYKPAAHWRLDGHQRRHLHHLATHRTSL